MARKFSKIRTFLRGLTIKQWAFFIGAVIFLLINKGIIRDFFDSADYSYEEVIPVDPTIQPVGLSTSTLRVSLKTRHAFVPQEKIKVKVNLLLPEILKSRAIQGKLFLYFPDSKQSQEDKERQNFNEFFGDTKMLMNTVKDTVRKIIVESTVLNIQDEGFILLRPQGELEWAGEGEIYFTSPGDHKYMLCLHPTTLIHDSPKLIPIGSTVDLFNVRNNQLIASLTVLALIITLLGSFKKD